MYEVSGRKLSGREKTSRMICGKCGISIPDDDFVKECPNCGASEFHIYK